MPIINIAPCLVGMITPNDLLSTQGHHFLVMSLESMDRSGYLFQLVDNNFIFQLEIENRGFRMRRNEVELFVSTIGAKSENILFVLHWTLSEIGIKIKAQEIYKDLSEELCPKAPPLSLIKFARSQNLIPISMYESEEAFRSKVYSCLQSINDKISSSGGITPFWNITYKGNSIAARTPKKETEMHPIIQCLLSDQLLMSSIEIIPEYQTGVGNLDFMFIGNVKGIGMTKMCVEFKNAHSDDLINGIEEQLPAYMLNTGASSGAYCVLYYKGSWFDQPSKFDTLSSLQSELYRKMGKGQSKYLRIFVFDLAKPESASKR